MCGYVVAHFATGYFLMDQRYTTKLYKFFLISLSRVASLWLQNLCRVQDGQRLLRGSVSKGNLIHRDAVAPLILGTLKMAEVKPVVVLASLHNARGSETEKSQEGCYFQVPMQSSYVTLLLCIFLWRGLTLSLPTTEGAYNDHTSH